ncbi:hypothetical protein BST81_18150 [Leptolyngbya sp. 'hensonii']|uniref:YihY/virulence factor BrkB family protein n=1 Tax=Leptolyngbya sp. 'hensonii' TaxID=1922337 RepID=UPI00094FD776|nr:YihY/virulence factor BrkB family protein [Leptolyngbya sp. 'hensonii']OLP16916.1 hypothetical protein BST81_18150 [Leptolyngbya sp. 'hensonii']
MFHLFRHHLNWKIFNRVAQGVVKQRLLGLASEMAYNNALALFPAMVAILTLIGTLKISREQVDGLVNQWSIVVPEEVVDLIANFAHQVRVSNERGVLSISFLFTVWIASSALNVAMNAMDHIHHTPLHQVRPYWKAKLVSLLLTIGMMVILLAASFLVFLSDLIVQFLADQLHLSQPFLLDAWALLRWVLALAILALGFSILYRFGPSCRHPETPLLPGALLGAASWAIISQGFRVYLEYFGSRLSLTYGALSAGILLLLWLNFSSLSLLIGAQLNVSIGQIRQRNGRR